ncbi:hypothetical protein Golob_025508 [Gossypium lobatum]|uniref:Protein kinase domain-containing protein n=1 Tax=Gossypium lobatum TaxID=34289 RepID=A0A7J8LSQ7_9ROSI|nr:hypothetical protein [Gossypium lobatum]
MDTDLHQIIRSNQALSEEHCQYFLYQILRGLKYIHSANVLHRDLKPSNLLLNANCDLKICDFGLARVTSESDFMTEYVVTRWYRAPELLLNSSDYTAAIDVWSVGCIFMELMDRKPLFPGRDHVHQLRLLIELIGTPSEAELGFLNANARRYIQQLPLYHRQSFTEKFPTVHPSAIDLVEKMLTFDPRLRITVEDALAHPYLSSLHDLSDEPVCMTPFNFDFEQHALTEEQMKELIYREALTFNPEYVQLHGNRFIGYDIYGKIFEVTAKYKPPIEPIGMGGYGIVWDIIPPLRIECFNDVYSAYELMDTDLHQKSIVRDLKPSNLLLNANCDLKICDFGMASVTSESCFMTEYVVTRWYGAPELLLNSSIIVQRLMYGQWVAFLWN